MRKKVLNILKINCWNYFLEHFLIRILFKRFKAPSFISFSCKLCLSCLKFCLKRLENLSFLLCKLFLFSSKYHFKDSSFIFLCTCSAAINAATPNRSFFGSFYLFFIFLNKDLNIFLSDKSACSLFLRCF